MYDKYPHASPKADVFTQGQSDHISYSFYDEVKINKYERVPHKSCIDRGCPEVYITYLLMQSLIEFNDCSTDAVHSNALSFFSRITHFKPGHSMTEVGDILVPIR